MSAAVNVYALTVLNPSSGQRRHNQVYAANERLAKLMALRDPAEVVTVERVNPLVENLLRSLFQTRASVKQMREFYASMASCLSIDRSLVRAFQLTIPNTSSPSLQFAASRLLEDLENGSPLSEALRCLDKVVPEEHIVMLSAGEKSGSIPVVFAQLAAALEKTDRSISKLKRAMIYPLIVFFVGAAALVLASLFLVPRVAEMFRSFKAELPLITKVMISISDFLRNQPLAVAALAAFPFFFFKNLGPIWAHPVTQHLVDSIPWTRKMVYKANMAQCLSTLCMLLGANIEIQDALEMTSRATTNRRVSNFFKRMRTDILSGLSPFEAANNHRALLGVDGFDLMARIHLGTENGNLKDILARVATSYQEDVDYQIKNIEVIIEPATIVLVGAFIGFLALSITLPLVKLNTLILPSRS